MREALQKELAEWYALRSQYNSRRESDNPSSADYYSGLYIGANHTIETLNKLVSILLDEGETK